MLLVALALIAVHFIYLGQQAAPLLSDIRQ